MSQKTKAVIADMMNYNPATHADAMRSVSNLIGEDPLPPNMSLLFFPPRQSVTSSAEVKKIVPDTSPTPAAVSKPMPEEAEKKEKKKKKKKQRRKKPKQQQASSDEGDSVKAKTAADDESVSVSVVESEPEEVDENFEMMLCLFSQKLSGFKRMFADDRPPVHNKPAEAEIKVDLPAETDDKKA